MTEETIKHAELALKSADPLLGALITSQTIAPPTPGTNYFASLSRSIIGQQVSVAAARAIATRFEERTKMEPAAVAALQEEAIRAIGLSRQKASYIQDLARHFITDPAVYNHLESQSDEQVITELTAVKGIGVWTAQMFLMFTLARPDVFAPDDVGLQRAMMRLYSWEVLPPKKQLVEVAEIWQPYRTVASLHLWQSLDNNPA
jgi:DNA-3-methyladenine glycosylase II